MIDAVSMTSMLGALQKPASATAGQATGTQPAADPSSPAFATTLTQTMMQTMNGGSGGWGSSEGESSDPAAELLPLLVQMALAQNPVAAAPTSSGDGAAPEAEGIRGGAALPAGGALFGGGS